MGMMFMDAKTFKRILKEGESISAEFKRGKEGAESDTYESICSMLNRWGGDIYLGIEDDNKTVTGVPKNAVQNHIKNIINMLGDPNIISPTVHLFPESFEYDDTMIIHIHVPESSQLHTCKKVYFDRIGDADIRVKSSDVIATMFMRKYDIRTEEKVYPNVRDEDLRFDLLPMLRQMAVNRHKEHPWEKLSDKEIIKSANLYTEDPDTKQWGYNRAAVLLLGKDDTIKRICPSHRTDALLRKVNVDRYDDRLIVETNLIESYDLLMGFARKHMLDKFYLEDDARISLSSKIAREMIVNSLAHREYTDGFYAKFVIEKDRMYVENACRAFKFGPITPSNLKPKSKNPIIAAFFRNIGYADELGSGTRNLYKYVKKYSGKDPEIIEDDIFKITVPLDDNYSADMLSLERPYGNLSPLEIEVFRAIGERRYTTAEKMATFLGTSPASIERSVAKLRDMGVIRRDGSKKKGSWELNR